jgi:hypothetical protein
VKLVTGSAGLTSVITVALSETGSTVEDRCIEKTTRQKRRDIYAESRLETCMQLAEVLHAGTHDMIWSCASTQVLALEYYDQLFDLEAQNF